MPHSIKLTILQDNPNIVITKNAIYAFWAVSLPLYFSVSLCISDFLPHCLSLYLLYLFWKKKLSIWVYNIKPRIVCKLSLSLCLYLESIMFMRESQTSQLQIFLHFQGDWSSEMNFSTSILIFTAAYKLAAGYFSYQKPH